MKKGKMKRQLKAHPCSQFIGIKRPEKRKLIRVSVKYPYADDIIVRVRYTFKNGDCVESTYFLTDISENIAFYKSPSASAYVASLISQRIEYNH